MGNIVSTKINVDKPVIRTVLVFSNICQPRSNISTGSDSHILFILELKTE